MDQAISPMESVACLCGAAQAPAAMVQARDAASGEGFTYLACAACSLERLSPRPVAAEIGRYYPQNYAPHVGFAPQGTADRLKRLAYEVFWATDAEIPPRTRRWRWLLRIVLAPARHRSILAFPPPEHRRVFEFGAARGTDLLAFKAAGWIAEGCEPSEQACSLAAAQGLHLQNATAEGAVLAPGAYSCILFNNVFEHIHDPAAVLAKCHAGLARGGVLILIVPNHDSLVGKLFGAAWPGYDAPRHIWGWTPKSVALQLARSGFSLDRIDQRASGAWLWRSVFNMQHSPGRPGRLRSWLSGRAAAIGVPFSILAALLGRGDFMRVVARRT